MSKIISRFFRGVGFFTLLKYAFCNFLNLLYCCLIIRFKEDGVVKYLEPAKELVSPEHGTLEVTFDDVDEYNQVLSTTIVEEYYR